MSDANEAGSANQTLFPFILLSFLLFFLCFTRPVADGDLWWQMAYGRYLLENGTLIPDHSIFSWTPVNNSAIYCAWLPQIVLYWAYQLGGLTAIAVVRYLIGAAIVVFVLGWGARERVLREPLPWLTLIACLPLSSLAGVVKANSFSFVFFICYVECWRRIRAQRGESLGPFVALPMITLVWVNAHGGFLVGYLFLGVAFAGELLNRSYYQDKALTELGFKRFFTALIACVACWIATPYGLRYPLWIANTTFLSYSSDAKQYQKVAEYGSILTSTDLMFPFFLTVLILWLAAHISSTDRRYDYGLMLPNVVFGILCLWLGRLAIFWPALFAAGMLEIGCAPSGREIMSRHRAKLSALALLLGVVLIFFRLATKSVELGISNLNPVSEAEVLDSHFRGARLGNDYNMGGYLIWRLFPATKVMMDSRYFPYREWYWRYAKLDSMSEVEETVRGFDAEVWCVGHLHIILRDHLAFSKEWQLAFWGNSGTLFVRRDLVGRYSLPFGKHAADLGEKGSLDWGLRLLEYATTLKDWEGADRLLAALSRRFTKPSDQYKLSATASYIESVKSGKIVP